MRITAPLALVLAIAVAGCAHAPSLDERVEVTAAGAGLKLAPRPATCDVQFFRTKPPDRAYDEVAALHLSVFADVGAVAVQDALRARACVAGADAVIVTREYASVGGFAGMAGVAVSYPEAREQHRAAFAREQDEAARARAEQDREASALQARRPASVPAEWVPATFTRDAVLRASPERRSAEFGEVAAGTVVWAAPTTWSGYRRVWVDARTTGYAEETDVALEAGRGGGTPAGVAPARRR